MSASDEKGGNGRCPGLRTADCFTSVDVVQLYYTAPYTAGEIEKSSVELGAFAKTKELAPGESEEVTLTVPVSDMASYDAYDANHNGFTGYELDAGDYIFTVRHDAHDVDDDANATITCSLPAGVQYAEDTATGNAVSNKFTGSDAVDGVSLDGSDSDQNITYLTRADFADTFPKTNTPTRVQMDAAEPSVSGYHCAAFTLDSNSHCVEKDGRSIHLADMEYRILTLFIRHPNTFFTANELYRKIWGKESLGDVRTVQVHIHNLRSKIEPDPAKPIYLKNVWGKGYIFRPEGETEA